MIKSEQILQRLGHDSRHPDPGRREFLSRMGTMGALATAALFSSRKIFARVTDAAHGKIDIHSHYAPPAWVSAVKATHGNRFVGNAEFVNAFKDWTPSKSIEQMDQAGVYTSMVSITTPGVWFGSSDSPVDATRRLARDCNEYGAKMAADFPGRFGLFAVLPLPDVEGSLREIEYALDTLKADGFGLLSHYSEIYGDRLLGDPDFAPVFEELNRRKAVVYVHRKISAGPNEIFGWDVHRAILSVLAPVGTGVEQEYAARFPNIRFIFCDAGGTMPFLIRRSTTPAHAPEIPAAISDSPAIRSLVSEVQKFYYGTGRSNNFQTLTVLKQIVPVSHILFGTDYPYARLVDEAAGLQICGAFDAGELATVGRENALSLLPRFRS
jgi:predicted TIM-barrel fold metal-dependent hydrolase